MKKNELLYVPLMLLALVTSVLSSCQDTLLNTTYRTSEVKMIDEYMEVPENNLSDFLAIIDKADYRGMLHAYGTYTCFAPTNNAVQAYLKEIGKTVDQLTEEEAKTIVGYHVVSDTISTASFVDGRLNSPNIVKQYLTTKTIADDAGNVSILVDRKATIAIKDVQAGNGLIQVIDKMLGVAPYSLSEKLAQLPDAQYSMMKGFVEETGIVNDLAEFAKLVKEAWDREHSTTTRALSDSMYLGSTNDGYLYYTFMLPDNDAFEKAGIKNKDDLMEILKRNTPNLSDQPEQLLYNFVGYHILAGRYYLVDMMTASAINTVVPKQVLSFSMTKDTILINEFKVGQLNEEGIKVDRNNEFSDYSCNNGVIQSIKGLLFIKKRAAYRVDFELTDQPEIRALKGYRQNGTKQVFTPGSMSELQWGGANNPNLTYECYTSYNTKGQYVYGDYLSFRLDSKVVKWMEFTTPLLIEGTYKVWMAWRRANPSKFRATFKQAGEEDQILPAAIDMSGYMPIIYLPETDSIPKNKIADHVMMEQTGWKQYCAREVSNVMNCYLMGIVRVTSTGRHILRLDGLDAAKGVTSWDMFQFIPIDDDQIWPMLDMKGNKIYPGTSGLDIYPNTKYSWED